LALPFYPPNTIDIAILLPVDAGVNPKFEAAAPDSSFELVTAEFAIFALVTAEFASSVPVTDPAPIAPVTIFHVVPFHCHVRPLDVYVSFTDGLEGNVNGIFYLLRINLIPLLS
jgi:hypothetical protein